MTTLIESGCAMGLEYLSCGDVAFLVEVVVDRAVYRGEFLQTSHAPETEHGPFSSSERLMTVFGAAILPFGR